MSFSQSAMMMLSCCIILCMYSIWIVPCLFLLMVPPLFLEARFGRVRWAVLYHRMGDERKMHYLARLATSDLAAKELRLFGLQDYLLKSWTFTFGRFCAEEAGVTKKYASPWLLPRSFERLQVWFFLD